MDFKLGQTVETSAGQQGLVQYIGGIHVAEGTWLGIELPTPNGKNDGSVKGERYFTCPILHGLFVRDTSIARVVAQPAAKKTPAAKAPSPVAAAGPRSIPKNKPTPPSAKSRPSSVTAPKPAPRISTVSTASKRQSVAAPASSTSLRPTARKPSTGALPTSSTSSSSSVTINTLETKLRHLEKVHTEDQERLKELAQIRDERDRFHAIIQKLQTKCQSLHQDLTEQKTVLQDFQDRHDKLLRAQEDHDIDLEDALIEREMAQERAEQAEGELDLLRSKLEERDLEVEVLREEAEMFTTEMSAEEREQAGYYRLQHENDRLRHALVALKELTTEHEADLKAQISELQQDIALHEALRTEYAALSEKASADSAIISHLRSQVDASAEWEEMANELTNRNQELEEKIASLELIVADLENLRELNDELEIQHAEQEEDMRAELDAKDAELAEQHACIESQASTIADQDDLINKFRLLVLDLQDKMQDADNSRSMTDDQVKATTGRFNEVMDLNRRLRAANIQATARQIDSELKKIAGDEATEKFFVCTESKSTDFVNGEPVQAYLASKRITAKAFLLSSLLPIIDEHTSCSGAIDEASTQLYCIEVATFLGFIQSNTTRLSSAMAAASLTRFAEFGRSRNELLTVEKRLDHGLDALSTDSVNYAELVDALKRSSWTLDAVHNEHHDALLEQPGDDILCRVQNITAIFKQLSSNFTVVNTVLGALVTNGQDAVQPVLDTFASSSAMCLNATGLAQKLLTKVLALRGDSLYPHFNHNQMEILHVEGLLCKLAREASQWGQEALRVASLHVDVDGSSDATDSVRVPQVQDLLHFHETSDMEVIPAAVSMLMHWIEDASVLYNAIEVQRWPTPWSQKAKEVEAAHKQSAEASRLLDSLAAEHRATLLSLHEQERALETKDLEIEHLEARFRDATTKVGEIEQLRSQMKDEADEITKLRAQVNSQQSEMAALEARAKQPDLSEQARQIDDEPRPLVEVPIQKHTPLLDTMLSALRDENHWLRQREHEDTYHRMLLELTEEIMLLGRPVFTGDYRNIEDLQKYASWLISDDDVEEQSPAPPSLENPVKEGLQDHKDLTRAASAARPKMPPLVLDNIQTSWQSFGDSVSGGVAARERAWDDDLSTIFEEAEGSSIFNSFIDDTMGLEGFSEVNLMDDITNLEDFSEVQL